MLGFRQLLFTGVMGMYFAAVPSTSNYMLSDYGFGSGGGTSSTSNYGLEGLTGEQSAGTIGTATYNARSGLLVTQMANVPGAPTLNNPANWYNKLDIILNTAANPSDTTYAVAISDDSFATTYYVQNDMTVGPALGTEDYQTYAAWGSGTGSTIVGLVANKTYSAKVSAFSGDFTESGYGPTATQTTSDVSLSFDIDVSASDSETSSPYALNLGELLAGSIVSGTDKIWFDLETNAGSGGKIFLFSQNSGLRSSVLTYTIASATTDLSGNNEAVGLQNASATQTSGGPLSAVSPYDGPGDNVGVTDTSVRQVYTAPGALVGGRTSMTLKAKVSQTTPAANDYVDTLTIIAAANY